jgi:hypothetical protein
MAAAPIANFWLYLLNGIILYSRNDVIVTTLPFFFWRLQRLENATASKEKQFSLTDIFGSPGGTHFVVEYPAIYDDSGSSRCALPREQQGGFFQ